MALQTSRIGGLYTQCMGEKSPQDTSMTPADIAKPLIAETTQVEAESHEESSPAAQVDPDSHEEDDGLTIQRGIE